MSNEMRKIAMLLTAISMGAGCAGAPTASSDFELPKPLISGEDFEQMINVEVRELDELDSLDDTVAIVSY